MGDVVWGNSVGVEVPTDCEDGASDVNKDPVGAEEVTGCAEGGSEVADEGASDGADEGGFVSACALHESGGTAEFSQMNALIQSL